ncbi:hypothetical protein [Emticicia fontis]
MTNLRKYFDLLNMVLEYRLLHKSKDDSGYPLTLRKKTEKAFEIFQKEIGLFQFYIYSSEVSPNGSFHVSPWLVEENGDKKLVPYDDNKIIKLEWYRDALNGDKEKNADEHTAHFKNVRHKAVEPEFVRIFSQLFNKNINSKKISLSDEEAQNSFMLVADGELSVFSLLYLLCPPESGYPGYNWATAHELFELLGFNLKKETAPNRKRSWMIWKGFRKKVVPGFSERYDRMLSWILKESDKDHPALSLEISRMGHPNKVLGDLLQATILSDKFQKQGSADNIVQILREELGQWRFRNEQDKLVPLLSSRQALQSLSSVRFNIEGEMHLRKDETLCRSFFATPLMYLEDEVDGTQYSTFVVGTIQDLHDLRDQKHLSRVKIIKLLINELARLKMDPNFVSGIAHKTMQVSKMLKELKLHASKNCETKILSRNFSHHIGSHVMVNVSVEQIRRRYRELCGTELSFERLDILKGRLDVYITERNEFLCDPDSALRPMLFYAQTILPFIENVLIQDNLCRSEGIGYNKGGGCDIQIAVIINGKPISVSFGGLAYPGQLPYDGTFAAGDNKGAVMQIHGQDTLIALPNVHIIFSILENFIRNTAKHQKARFKRNPTPEDRSKGLVDQLRVELRLDELDQDAYQLTISDNVSRVDSSFLEKQNCDIMDENNAIAQKDLGIIDFKICAGLLNKKPFRDVGKELFEIRLGPKGELSYTFRILKPKDLCLIGYTPDIQIPAFTYYSDAATFCRSVKPVVPYSFCLIKEQELPRLLEDCRYTNWLPSRILVERDNAATEQYWQQQQYPRKFLVIDPISAESNPEALMELCWQRWLGRWKIGPGHKSEVIIYSEQKIAGLEDARFESSVLDFQYGYGYDDAGGSKDIRSLSDNYPKVFYDHHGGGLSNAGLPANHSFISSSAYVPFGKNSLDLALVRHAHSKPFWTLPYQLAEAGLARVLIIDERILDIAAERFERSEIYPLAAIGKFWYGCYTESLTKFDEETTKVHNLDSYWASNIAVTSHLNEVPIKKNVLDGPEDHWVKINVGEDQCTTTLNFDLLHEKPCTLTDVEDISKLPYDVVVIHRTFLNKESLDRYWQGQSSEAVLEKLNRCFPFVFITSGGGDVITYKGDFKFISFNNILHCLVSPENIGKQTLINNLLTI